MRVSTRLLWLFSLLVFTSSTRLRADDVEDSLRARIGTVRIEMEQERFRHATYLFRREQCLRDWNSALSAIRDALHALAQPEMTFQGSIAAVQKLAHAIDGLERVAGTNKTCCVGYPTESLAGFAGPFRELHGKAVALRDRLEAKEVEHRVANFTEERESARERAQAELRVDACGFQKLELIAEIQSCLLAAQKANQVGDVAGLRRARAGAEFLTRKIGAFGAECRLEGDAWFDRMQGQLERLRSTEPDADRLRRKGCDYLAGRYPKDRWIVKPAVPEVLDRIAPERIELDPFPGVDVPEKVRDACANGYFDGDFDDLLAATLDAKFRVPISLANP